MQVCGIIAEYNPLHNGHIFQLGQTRADVNVVILSGNFVQRGAPAILDKWTRARLAVLHGAHVVLELPVDFSLSSAERFAYGGVYMLHALGGINTLCFGAENSLDDLNACAEMLSAESMDTIVKHHGKGCVPYHALRNLAVNNNDIIKKPNNILGIEYLKALKKLASPIQPVAIERIGTSHHATEPSDKIASASFIRNALQNKEDCSAFFPYTLPHAPLVTEEVLYPLIRSAIFSRNLENIADVREGIENRIYEMALKSESFHALVESVSTKRYTKSAIRRMLMQILLNMKKSELAPHPQYARLLAATQKGCEYLKIAKKSTHIPIVTKGAGAPACPELDLDVRASNIYSAVAYPDKAVINDFNQTPFITNDR